MGKVLGNNFAFFLNIHRLETSLRAKFKYISFMIMRSTTFRDFMITLMIFCILTNIFSACSRNLYPLALHVELGRAG